MNQTSILVFVMERKLSILHATVKYIILVQYSMYSATELLISYALYCTPYTNLLTAVLAAQVLDVLPVAQ